MKTIQNEIFRKCGHRIIGTNDVSSLVVKNCIFENCNFGYNASRFSDRRDIVKNSLFEDCKISKCLMGPAIIRSSRVSNLKNDMLICWGTLFDQVVIDGKLGPIMLHGIPAGNSDKSEREIHKTFANQFYANVEFALDISNALFTDFSIRTDAVPLSLIRRDVNSQFIVSKSVHSNEPKWIESLSISVYTKILFTLMNDDDVHEALLVAPKLDAEMYDQILRDADVLEREGMLR